MKSPQRRSSSRSVVAALHSELGRLRRALAELGRAGARLQPALVPVPIGRSSLPPQERPLPSRPFQMAFGRRKDGKSQDEDESDGEEVAGTSGQLASENEPDLAQLPPIPSAMGATDIDEEEESDQTAPPAKAVSGWAPLEPAPAETGTGVEAESEGGTLPEADLPAWGSRAIEASAFETPVAAGTVETGPGSEEPAPWGSAALDDDDQTTFAPSVVDPRGVGVDNLTWLPEGADEPAPWAVTAETEDQPAAATSDTFTSGATEVFEEVDQVHEIPAETPAEEVEIAPEPESLPEIETVSVEHWAAPEPVAVATEAAVFPTASDVFGVPTSDALLLQTRSFPLPEGELIFRNLRAGFTDPSRLLRHLAGEGHTGVLHVLGVDGSNGYVVLVDGYVVAVANDRQGSITTTTRVTFPNFPNSQDAINVISYSRQIARGLGLVLHAPVRFAGLGAMFVNLEGLRSYLSKYSSSGGLIVHAQEGIGVALFDDGKLVGAYANGNAPTSDLAQLKDLVKDLEAEIDVRFGGPKELEPIPLDTLLSGYPL